MRYRFLSGWLGASLCSFLLLLIALGTFSAGVRLDAPAAQAAEPAEDNPTPDNSETTEK